MRKGLLFIFVMAFIVMSVNAQVMLTADPDFKAGQQYPFTKDVLMHWDGDNLYPLGMGGGADMISLAHFDAADLLGFGVVGGQLTEIHVYVCGLASIYQGIIVYSESEGNPGTIVYEEEFASPSIGWNTFTLATPYNLEGTGIFLGYRANHVGGEYPTGFDAGPAVNKGDWTSFNGGTTWIHLSDLEYGNWNVRGFATSVTVYAVTFTVDDGTDPINGAVIDIEAGTYSGTTDASGITTFDLADGEYNYSVTATGYETYSGTVTVHGADEDVVVSMDKEESVNIIVSKINIYPNPSNGVFNVNVENNFNLEVLDITGKVIHTRVLTGNSTVEINTAGVYFLRFSNEKGSVTQRVIVQ